MNALATIEDQTEVSDYTPIPHTFDGNTYIELVFAQGKSDADKYAAVIAKTNQLVGKKNNDKSSESLRQCFCFTIIQGERGNYLICGYHGGIKFSNSIVGKMLQELSTNLKKKVVPRNMIIVRVKSNTPRNPNKILEQLASTLN